MITRAYMQIMQIPGMAALISLVLGFGIAAMFRPLCKGADCLLVRGPPVHEIADAVYQFGKKCVEFQAKPMECPAKTSGVEVVETLVFADVA
jgi:hypothetical protein